MAQHHRHHDEEEDLDDVLFRRVAFDRSADMNVTPLIDVLLVLLVIFIAALPLTQKGMDINLPLEVQSKPTPTDVKQVIIKRAADRQITVNEQPVELDALPEVLRQIFASREEKLVFVNGSAELMYGEVMPLIDAATAVKLRVAVITPGVQALAQRPK